MCFEVTFLGVSGGPIEGRTSCMLVKPAHISYVEILEKKLKSVLLAVDAGVGMGKLSETIYLESNGLPFEDLLLNMYNDARPFKDYCKVTTTRPFERLPKSISSYALSMKVYNLINNYLITHAHLDHILGLAINSAGMSGQPKVYGNSQTIEYLDKHIFNDCVWPDMCALGILQIIAKSFDSEFVLDDMYSVRMLETSHGLAPVKGSQRFKKYLSSAYLITYLPCRSSLLVFGDFESDLVSGLKNNQRVWEEIAPLICREQNLKAIIMECSEPQNTDLDKLYGHLKPEHLIYELTVLRSICIKLRPEVDQPLEGINIIINHIKESINGEDPRMSILHELETRSEREELGVIFSVPISGMSVIL